MVGIDDASPPVSSVPYQFRVAPDNAVADNAVADALMQ